MKIAFCINTLSTGGAERVVSILANYFSDGHDVTILTLGSEKASYTLKKNVKIRRLSNKELGIVRNIAGKIITSIDSMKHIEKDEGFDIVISFLPEASFVTILAKLSCPVIISVRNDPEIEYRNYIYKTLMKKLYSKADGFVFQTVDAEKYFERTIGRTGAIILNPVDPKVVALPPFTKKDKSIVAVGRLEKQKNFPLLIKSFSRICSKHPEYRLIIYGEGSERVNLERLVKSLGVENKVSLPGEVSNVVDRIRNCAVFVLPSDYEGMPNALMEAMIVGLPVISTDCPCGGPRSIIEDGKNGFLVPVDDVEKLTSRLDKLLLNEKLRDKLGKNAAMIIRKVSPNKICKEWEEYIKKVLKNRKVA